MNAIVARAEMGPRPGYERGGRPMTHEGTLKALRLVFVLYLLSAATRLG